MTDPTGKDDLNMCNGQMIYAMVDEAKTEP